MERVVIVISIIDEILHKNLRQITKWCKQTVQRILMIVLVMIE